MLKLMGKKIVTFLQNFWLSKPVYYSTCSEISNTFLFLFANILLVIRAFKKPVTITKREDPDQTVSLETLCSGFALFV